MNGGRLTAGDARPERDFPRYTVEPGVDRDRVGPRIAPQHPYRARIGANQPEQNANSRRLPRAVGPQESVHLADANGQVEGVERPRAAEGFRQPGNGDGSVVGHHCRLRCHWSLRCGHDGSDPRLCSRAMLTP